MHSLKIDLRGKTSIVTGGTRGIGKAICDILFESGCNIIATGTRLNKGMTPDKKRLKYVQLDFLDPDSVKSFIKTVRQLKRVDILINNAGINIIEPINKMNKHNWDKVLQVNLTGPMLLIKEISSVMKKQKKGRILNISSIWAAISKEGRSSYSASKTGLIGLTRTAALDLASHNILVNALCPGFTLTELTHSTLSKEEITSLSERIPLRRLAKADEIARVAVFLCSDLNTYITGQSIIADGGFVIR